MKQEGKNRREVVKREEKWIEKKKSGGKRRGEKGKEQNWLESKEINEKQHTAQHCSTHNTA